MVGIVAGQDFGGIWYFREFSCPGFTLNLREFGVWFCCWLVVRLASLDFGFSGFVWFGFWFSGVVFGLVWVSVSVEVVSFGLGVLLRVDFETLGFECLIRLFVLAVFLVFRFWGISLAMVELFCGFGLWRGFCLLHGRVCGFCVLVTFLLGDGFRVCLGLVFWFWFLLLGWFVI